MLTNTQSYLLLRAYIQESLDYAYLTCHAVPALNAYMKAVDNGLGLPHDQSMKENIARIREIRNGSAHGRCRSYQLKASMDDLKLLRKYALAIDQHVLTHYMIIVDVSA